MLIYCNTPSHYLQYSNICPFTVVGLSGVYDIEKHFLFEATRGVHEISPMGAAAITRDRFGAVSPTCLISQLCREKIQRFWYVE